MKLVSFASGSSGNCTYIGSDSTHILIDAGISCKKIVDSLKALGLSPDDLTGIFITHEHIDHIKGLRVFTKKYDVPVYASPNTYGVLKGDGHVPFEKAHRIEPDVDTEFGNLKIHPFRNRHDAADPVGYTVQCGDKRVAVVTDLGIYTDYTVSNLHHLNAILVEANHDIRMLETGPYPYQLKRRILSNYGHLCNEACGRLLSEIMTDELKHIILGHLSAENNLPDLALMAVKAEIDAAPNKYRSEDIDITVAPRNEMSKIVEL